MKPEQKQMDLLWGIDAIAEALGRTRMQTYPLLKKGILPAKQLNGRWVMTREALQKFFDEIAA